MQAIEAERKVLHVQIDKAYTDFKGLKKKKRRNNGCHSYR